MTLPTCPCCGGPIVGAKAMWNRTARTLIAPERAVTFGPVQARIFDALWRARQSGEFIGAIELAARVYCEDEDGGPESRTVISMHLLNMRIRMKGCGLVIAGKLGRGGGVRLAKEYDADADIRESVKVGLAAVKERMAAGGKGWPA